MPAAKNASPAKKSSASVRAIAKKEFIPPSKVKREKNDFDEVKVMAHTAEVDAQHLVNQANAISEELGWLMKKAERIQTQTTH
jgi:uncharacterized coiled-coil DUF342 family protein